MDDAYFMVHLTCLQSPLKNDQYTPPRNFELISTRVLPFHQCHFNTIDKYILCALHRNGDYDACRLYVGKNKIRLDNPAKSENRR